MDPHGLLNLVAFSIQAACLVALAWAFSAVVRMDAARVRYAWWRGVLVACLLLPWIQGRAEVPVAVETVASIASIAPTAAEPVPTLVSGPPAPGVPWPLVLAAVLAGGALARLAWLGLGLLRLRRLRRAGRPLAPREDVAQLQRMLGTRAELRQVADLDQPVTFGVIRPVILLPDALMSHPPEIRQAVIGHELVHVRRRDWMWLVVEEVVRATFWFHPAIWWLVSRIQQVREEVVDETTVLVTRRRRAYIEALVAFADAPTAVATAAFSRRSHLFRRIVLLSREAVMSARHIVLSSACMALVVGSGGWYATDLFPLVRGVSAQAQEVRLDAGPLERAAEEITPENPIPRRIFSVPAAYPPEGLATGARAVVSLRGAIDDRGSVAEVRRVSVSVLQAEPPPALVDAFVRAAAEALGRWQFDPPARAPIVIEVSFLFQPGEPDATERMVPRAAAVTRTITTGAGTASTGPAGTGTGAASGTDALSAGTPPDPSAQILRVGGGVREPTKVRHVSPRYPPLAQQARVGGVVIVEAVIGDTGQVTYARVLRSVPLLDQAALEAVMQWEFTPTLLNGQPVPVMMTVTISFALN